MTKALEETNYGICIYESTNDVPDNQTISKPLVAVCNGLCLDTSVGVMAEAMQD